MDTIELGIHLRRDSWNTIIVTQNARKARRITADDVSESAPQHGR